MATGANAAARATPVVEPRKLRRRRRIVLGTLLLLLLPWLVFGCTASVTPPPVPADAVKVFVLREAMHTGLVLPPDPAATSDPEQFVEFGFGDWHWYALGNEEWYNAFATVLLPTQGALGRRTFGARDEAELRQRAHWAELAPVVVSRAKAAALRRRLQGDFDAVIGALVERRDFGFRFVPADHMYWLPRNCNDEVADWLEALDCEVSWCPARLAIEVVERVP